MGTSMSSPGSGGSTPLVPPWADDQPQTPLPPPEPNRFKPFRQALGKFVKTGDRQKLKSALGHYARKASGGSGGAVRRMGTVTASGGALFGVLQGVAAGDPTRIPANIDLAFLSGQPCDSFIDAIATSLTPVTGDADKVRKAINHALSEALEGVEVFDPRAISDEVIINTMLAYLTESIFVQIVMESGRAFTKGETSSQRVTAERELGALIKAVVDSKMAPMFVDGIRNLEGNEVVELQRQAIRSVWEEWENYK